MTRRIGHSLRRAARLGALGALLLLAAGSAWADGRGPSPVLRLDGIGPLRLGMGRAEAVATGWLSDPGTGCELDGPPLPVVYKLKGPKAPAGIVGTVEFDRGLLRVLAFSAGVKTAFGIAIPGATASDLVKRARAAGFSATSAYDETFAGRFVTVNRAGKQVLGAFAEQSAITTIAVPYVPVCD
ncbi:hypothetical protein [Cyanobium gracile]|uniref:Uncharacterized protein n=1 Tax=Cyanobium gracile UHCC 0281 TaxID=3110309 RepID=A0ABU5SWM6_9CYAN|nr:hypothetical protein [Cyanobium gracile]MEA5442818.1 hypothetical protein [Cyanobium gracile UHCC 0281]